MSNLVDFVQKHAVRGQCRCGRCVDGGNPDDQPTGHTADVFFFDVAMAPEGAEASDFRKLIQEHKSCFGEPVDPLDGQEHSYIQLGGWIGDQGLALMLMGLGAVLGVWRVLTPKIIGLDNSNPLAQQLAGAGMVTIQASN